MTDFLAVSKLQKYFRAPRRLLEAPSAAVRAVEDVSFSIRQGESFALVGESGCGKSTVARCILGLLEPDAGAVQIQGESLAELRRREPRRAFRAVQMVFQDPYSSLNPRLTVGSAIAEPLAIEGGLGRAAIAERVASLLAEVGLEKDAAFKYPHQFSGGQRQRIGIARALALEPSLLIADEPVSALDVSIQSQILLLLQTLQRSHNLSLLLITHDLGVVRNFCDRMAVMYLGRIVEDGPVASLLDAPLHPYTSALRDAALAPDMSARGRLARLTGEMPSAANPPSACHFHPRCPIAVPRCSSVDPAWRSGASGRSVRCDLVQDSALS